MSPPVTFRNDRIDCTWARAPVAIQPHAKATAARERGRARMALEIVPLVLVEGSENFGRVHPPHLAPHAAATRDNARELA